MSTSSAPSTRTAPVAARSSHATPGDSPSPRHHGAHARRVQQILRSHGVRTVITIDPHTTHMLRTVYPTLLGDFDVTVRSYLEVLAERNGAAVAAPAARSSCTTRASSLATRAWWRSRGCSSVVRASRCSSRGTHASARGAAADRRSRYIRTRRWRLRASGSTSSARSPISP